jgi:hypothetical protein
MSLAATPPEQGIPRPRRFFCQLDSPYYRQMSKIAKQRGVKLTSLLRAAAIPEWLEENRDELERALRWEAVVLENGLTMHRCPDCQGLYHTPNTDHPCRSRPRE